MSPRTAEAYQRIKDARREEILAAGLRVFARKGLAATRIGDLAAEAHISQGLVYHYFPDKESLFTAIVEDALRETAALTAGVLQGPGSAWERIQLLCHQMLEGALEDPDYVLVTLQAFTSETVPDQARSAVLRYGRKTLRDLLKLVRQGQEEGRVVQGDPVELAMAFTAAIQGAALSHLQGGGGGSTRLRAETLLRLLQA